MQKHTLTFEQLPDFVYALGGKVDQLIALLSSGQSIPIPDEIGGVDMACEITRLSSARIYTLVSKRLIPHKKRGNRLTFRRAELLAWLDEGNRETIGGPNA